MDYYNYFYFLSFYSIIIFCFSLKNNHNLKINLEPKSY